VPRRVWILGLVLVALLGTGAGLCRFKLDCHLRSGDAFRGIAGTGKGETSLPSGFRQDVVLAGLDYPTSFAFLPGGRMLIAEKEGLVKMWQRGSLLRVPVLDLRDRVDTYYYRGLLTIEPAPDFARSGHLFVLYARARPGEKEGAPTTVRLSRFTVRNNVALPGSEKVILGTEGSGSCNALEDGSDCLPCDSDHCGGDVEFAPEGALWLVTGEGWNGVPGPNALRAQKLDSLGGKVLRVTTEGNGLPDNPYWTGDARDNRSKIWAYGLRNPFRFDLAPGGRPYIGNVGWNAWEEIELAVRGANLGWPCYEARERPSAYASHPLCRALYGKGPAAVKFPLIRYPRGSVTGGVIYTGDAFPARYRGAYFYGDWSYSWLRSARVGPDGRLFPHDFGAHSRTSWLRGFSSSPSDFATRAAGPVQIENGPDGSLYYLAANAGEVRRIRTT
jgi:glucose/arabinose dehydrogenase